MRSRSMTSTVHRTTAIDADRRSFLKLAGCAIAASALRPPAVFAAPRFDLILRGGLLLDGTGLAAYPADVGIIGDRIAAVGSISLEQGARVLDVGGLHVCPGFIDIHSHSDGDILLHPRANNRVRQGITTELTGNCGRSAAPLVAAGADAVRRSYRKLGIEATWTGVASYYDVLDKADLSINQALLVGQGTIRANAIGYVDRGLSPNEQAAVVRAVEEAMDEGAFGLSTGLEYTPGCFTPTDEIISMARVVGRHGGLYASHIRSEDTKLLEAINEALAIGRASGARVQISHLKASGRPNWNNQQAALRLIASARRDGVPVLADAYPYTAYSTTLTILLPGPALEGGTGRMLKRLGDAAWRKWIRREVEDHMARELGDYALIVIARVNTSANQAWVGWNVNEVAAAWGVEPADAVLRLIEEERGSVSIIGHGMSPENVETVLRDPFVMLGSDGSAMGGASRSAGGPHPRSYGAFARLLAFYVGERRALDLAQAVRKMTSMPADQIGLTDRGRIARGQKADLVVFDAARVKDMATFQQPRQYAIGIPHVLVNGVAVVENGRHTGARPGRALRRT
jgi:N-acyl-D-amino-acid deacylase